MLKQCFQNIFLKEDTMLFYIRLVEGSETLIKYLQQYNIISHFDQVISLCITNATYIPSVFNQ